MADSSYIAKNPLEQTANPVRASPAGTPGIISFGPYMHIAAPHRLEQAGHPIPLDDRKFAGGAQGNCQLWNGHIIDATVPLL